MKVGNASWDSVNPGKAWILFKQKQAIHKLQYSTSMLGGRSRCHAIYGTLGFSTEIMMMLYLHSPQSCRKSNDHVIR